MTYYEEEFKILTYDRGQRIRQPETNCEEGPITWTSKPKTVILSVTRDGSRPKFAYGGFFNTKRFVLTMLISLASIPSFSSYVPSHDFNHVGSFLLSNHGHVLWYLLIVESLLDWRQILEAEIHCRMSCHWLGMLIMADLNASFIEKQRIRAISPANNHTSLFSLPLSYISHENDWYAGYHHLSESASASCLLPPNPQTPGHCTNIGTTDYR